MEQAADHAEQSAPAVARPEPGLAPQQTGPEGVLALQRSAGNRAVGRLLGNRPDGVFGHALSTSIVRIRENATIIAGAGCYRTTGNVINIPGTAIPDAEQQAHWIEDHRRLPAGWWRSGFWSSPPS